MRPPYPGHKMWGFAQSGIEKIDIQFGTPSRNGTPEAACQPKFAATSPPSPLGATADASSLARRAKAGMGIATFRGRRPETEHCPMFATLALLASLLVSGVAAAAEPVHLIPVSYVAPDRTAVD